MVCDTNNTYFLHGSKVSQLNELLDSRSTIGITT